MCQESCLYHTTALGNKLNVLVIRPTEYPYKYLNWTIYACAYLHSMYIGSIHEALTGNLKPDGLCKLA